MGYWDWYYTGDSNPERTKMRKQIEGKKQSEMTEAELVFYRAEQVRRQAKLERDARRMQEEAEEAARKLDKRYGL